MDRRGKIMWVNEETIKKRELSLMFENEGGGGREGRVDEERISEQGIN